MFSFESMIGEGNSLIWISQFWFVLLAAFGSAFIATWFCKKVAIKFGIVDQPDNLVKTHKEAVAYLGGVGMFVGLVAGILASIYHMYGQAYFGSAFKWLLGILGGCGIACFIGVVDDIFDIKPWQKICGQLIAASVLIFVGLSPILSKFTGLLGFELPGYIDKLLGMLAVVVIVVGATNSLNLLDGLDGLCAGVTGIISIAFLILALHLSTWEISPKGDSVRIVLCIGLVGSVCGFLPFNRYPAKIFMGDAGSMLLGFAIAALIILFMEITPRWFLPSLLIFGLPILDTSVALIRRLLNKRPLLVSDRGHLYDQMMDRGIPLKKTVAICYALTAMYAILGLGLAFIRARYAVVIFAAIFVISVIVVWRKGFLKMEGLRGAIQKKI